MMFSQPMMAPTVHPVLSNPLTPNVYGQPATPVYNAGMNPALNPLGGALAGPGGALAGPAGLVNPLTGKPLSQK